MIIQYYTQTSIFPIHDLSPGFLESNTTDETSGGGTVYHSGTYEFTPVILVGLVLLDL